MKKKLRGIKRDTFLLDFDLYRTAVPIPTVANANLSVIDINPEGAQKTIFFVHGYAGCAETWEHQINYFALEREYRVIAPDLRGHGQSDAPFTQYTMDELVADIHTIADTLELPERFVLVGHSFGGSICAEYASAHPESLEKLVLIATAGEYPLPRAVSWLSRIPVAVFRPFWKYRPRWNAEVHVMKRMMLNNLRKWQGWSKLRGLTVPTQIITGEKDTYFPRHVFEEVGKIVPGAEVYDIGAAKHKVQLERRSAVNKAIERFILGDNKIASWRESSIAQHGHRPWLASYQKETPFTVPIPRQPLQKFLESAAEWVPKRKATIFYGTSLTYQQLERQANQLAHVLLGMGIGPGDRVILVMPNTPQFIIAYYAILKTGAAIVLPNPDADAVQIVRHATVTQAKALITLLEFAKLASAVKQNTTVRDVIFADIRHSVSGLKYKSLISRWGESMPSIQEIDEQESGTVGGLMHRLTMDAPVTSPGVKVTPDMLACIIFTSGTTSHPKGVCLTHSNLVANTMQTRHWIPELQYGKEVCLSVVPLLHSYGMTNAMNIPIAIGATIILQPVFELQQILESIKKYRPTIFPGVPSMYMAINHAPNVRSYGLSSIKACLSGAAPLPVEVQESFEKLTHGRLVEGYGLTEASPVTHANPLFGTRKVGSIGVPLPNTDAKIVDIVSGEDLPPGKIGELIIKGPQVMQGYWQEESEPPQDGESTLANGWLYTGDIAIMDSDGYFQIISRKRDTIMAGDYSVYPRDVEEVLYENSKVLEVAVVGIGHLGENGQKVKAFVVPRPGSELSADELLDLCRRRLEPYAVPWQIEFRETLPKSFVGKVLRRLLVDEEHIGQETIDETDQR